jgi:hypothetical protein
MSYLDDGFDNNLIRNTYPNTESLEDSSILSEIVTAGAIPTNEVTNALVATGIINTNNVIITDLISDTLDTQAKEILSTFTFGTSGAIAMITDANNGIWLSPTGILAKKASANTFALEIDGDATFGGNLVAATGTLGALTIASGGNIKFGKTAYTDDTNAGFWLGDVSGTAKLNIGASATKYLHYDGSDLTMLGGTITGGIVQTAASSYRLRMNGSNNKFESLNGNTVLGSIYADASGDLILDGVDDVNFATGGTIKCLVATGAFKPAGDGSYNLGASDAQWNDIYLDGKLDFGAFSIIQSSSGTIFYSGTTEIFRVSSAGNVRCGAVFESSDGTDGYSHSGYGFLNGIRWDGGTLQARFSEIVVKDGLITDFNQGSYYDV